MKFEEKLIKLRQENSISQEELAEKLNVSKELIEEWELGKSKPNMDKIVEIASLFNLSTDELLNEMNSTIKQETASSENDKKNNKTTIIIVVSILALIIILCVAGFFACRAFFSLPNKIKEKAFNDLDEIIEKGEEYQNKQNDKFNNTVNNMVEQFNDSVKKREEQIDNSANKIEDQITNSLDNIFQQFSN